MKVKVNQDTCIGCGACVAICEDVFKMNNKGISVVKQNPVKKEYINEAIDAIDSCPTGAIEKVDEDEEEKDKK